MNNWTVRTRIIGAFAAVITIMIALGAVSYAGLRTIRSQARQIEKDVLPGVVISAKSQAIARELLLAVNKHSAASTARDKQLAADKVEQLLQSANKNDEAYQATIIDESDRQLFSAMKDARDRFAKEYDLALADQAITQDELSTRLQPPLEEYVKLGDSLFELNRAQGVGATTDITASADKSLWTLGPSLVFATIVAVFCSWMLVRLIQSALARLMTVTAVMSAGDFRERIEIVRRDELGMLGEGINRMADDLTNLIGQVQKSGVQVNSSATEIAATSKQQQATVTEIAATTAEVGATASRISATSKELARTMGELSEVADQTSTLAQGGQGGLQRMESTMGQIGAASDLDQLAARTVEREGNEHRHGGHDDQQGGRPDESSLAQRGNRSGEGRGARARLCRGGARDPATRGSDGGRDLRHRTDRERDAERGERRRHGDRQVRRRSPPRPRGDRRGDDAAHRDHRAGADAAAVLRERERRGAVAVDQRGADLEALAQLSVASQQTADSLRQSSMAIDQLNDASRGLQSGVQRFTLAA